jgi:hypothetical protein
LYYFLVFLESQGGRRIHSMHSRDYANARSNDYANSNARSNDYANANAHADDYANANDYVNDPIIFGKPHTNPPGSKMKKINFFFNSNRNGRSIPNIKLQ